MVSTSLRSVLISVKCIVLTLDDVLIYFDHVFFTIVVTELLVGCVNEKPLLHVSSVYTRRFEEHATALTKLHYLYINIRKYSKQRALSNSIQL